MSLLRNVTRWNTFVVRIKPNQAASPLLHHCHHFSTGTEEPTPTPTPTPDSSVLHPPKRGLVYGRLSGVGKHTLRTDIINLLQGCHLSPQDVKVEYNRIYHPLSMIVQFPSPSGFENAAKIIRTKRLYKLDKVDRSTWDIQQTYQGKTVLLQGIPRNAQLEDVERLLSGCEFNASNIQLFNRQTIPEPTKEALVQFPSQIEAMNTVIMKNRGFCLNSQILMRVLQ